MGVQINRPGQAPEPIGTMVKPAGPKEVQTVVEYRYKDYSITKEEFIAGVKNIGNKACSLKEKLDKLSKKKYRLESVVDAPETDEPVESIDMVLYQEAEALWDKLHGE